MEDKIFALLEKMYSELIQFKQETNERFDEIDSKFDGIDTRFDGIDAKVDGLKGHIIRMENDHSQKLNALFDGYKQSIEGIEEINRKLDKLTDRVENQEIKLQVLKSVK